MFAGNGSDCVAPAVHCVLWVCIPVRPGPSGPEAAEDRRVQERVHLRGGLLGLQSAPLRTAGKTGDLQMSMALRTGVTSRCFQNDSELRVESFSEDEAEGEVEAGGEDSKVSVSDLSQDTKSLLSRKQQLERDDLTQQHYRKYVQVRL